MSVCKWEYHQDVFIISKKHSAEIADVKNKHSQVREKPNIVRDYNNGMAGTDRSDQMLSYYSSL